MLQRRKDMYAHQDIWIEDIYYDMNHIRTVLSVIKKNFEKYFEEFLMTNAGTVLSPRVNLIAANETNPMGKLNQLFVKVGRFQALIVFAVIFGFVLFGKEFIILWAGAEYEQAYYVTLLLIVPVAIPLCQTLGVDIQRALNKHQYRSVVYAVIALMNLGISIPLAKNFGAVGAALGTTISLLIGNGLIMNILYL